MQLTIHFDTPFGKHLTTEHGTYRVTPDSRWHGPGMYRVEYVQADQWCNILPVPSGVLDTKSDCNHDARESGNDQMDYIVIFWADNGLNIEHFDTIEAAENAGLRYDAKVRREIPKFRHLPWTFYRIVHGTMEI